LNVGEIAMKLNESFTLKGVTNPSVTDIKKLLFNMTKLNKNLCTRLNSVATQSRGEFPDSGDDDGEMPAGLGIAHATQPDEEVSLTGTELADRSYNQSGDNDHDSLNHEDNNYDTVDNTNEMNTTYDECNEQEVRFGPVIVCQKNYIVGTTNCYFSIILPKNLQNYHDDASDAIGRNYREQHSMIFVSDTLRQGKCIEFFSSHFPKRILFPTLGATGDTTRGNRHHPSNNT
jgi:hypothetical protein